MTRDELGQMKAPPANIQKFLFAFYECIDDEVNYLYHDFSDMLGLCDNSGEFYLRKK